MRRVMITSLGMLGLAASLAACAPRYDGFDCTMINDTPSGAQCTEQGIVVAQGEALVLRLRARSETRQEYEDVEVELVSDDPQIAEVLPSIGGDQTVIGLTIGETTAQLRIDGEVEDEVLVRVVAFRPSNGHD